MPCAPLVATTSAQRSGVAANSTARIPDPKNFARIDPSKRVIA